MRGGNGSVTDIAQLARAHLAHCCSGNWAALRAMTGRGYAYCEAGTGRRIDDIDKVLAAWQRLRAAAPDVYGSIGQVLTESDVTVADVVWSATLLERQLRVADRVWARWEDRRLVAEWHEVGILSLVAPLVDAQLRARDAATSTPGCE
jgi:hypothetical protein